MHHDDHIIAKCLSMRHIILRGDGDSTSQHDMYILYICPGLQEIMDAGNYND